MSTDNLRTILTPTQAAEYLGVSVRFLLERRKTGDGPNYAKIHDHAIRYRRVDLDAWVATLATGDHGAVATTGEDDG